VLDDLAPDNRSTVMLLMLSALPVGATPKRSVRESAGGSREGDSEVSEVLLSHAARYWT